MLLLQFITRAFSTAITHKRRAGAKRYFSKILLIERKKEKIHTDLLEIINLSVPTNGFMKARNRQGKSVTGNKCKAKMETN